MNSPPPVYSPDISNTPGPPAYEPPTSYQIGQNTLTESLVNVEHIKIHLALLGAFAELKEEVKGSNRRFPVDVEASDSEQRWEWFISLAVERYAQRVRF